MPEVIDTETELITALSELVCLTAARITADWKCNVAAAALVGIIAMTEAGHDAGSILVNFEEDIVRFFVSVVVVADQAVGNRLSGFAFVAVGLVDCFDCTKLFLRVVTGLRYCRPVLRIIRVGFFAETDR